MADSQAFTHLCDELESRTGFDRLEARGTVRIALKAAGLEAESVSGKQLAVVVERMLPDELDSRGVPKAESICRMLAQSLGALPESDGPGDSPEDVFGRIGSR